MSRDLPTSGLSRREFIAVAGLAAARPLSGLRGQPVSALHERRFRENRGVLANPERGFYAQRRSDRMERLENLREQGIALLLVTLDLREFKDRELDAAKLGELQRALGVAGEHGFKVIFRAAYGFTDRDYRADPHDLGRIVGHIRQIGAVLAEMRAVVFSVQAGMLGPWGEWHGSNHGNPPSLEARRAVLFAWLDAVPPPIAVQVRRPMFIRDIFADATGGSDLKEDDPFTATKLARTGWHNDALFVPPTDLGTYAERGWDRERELAWCSRHGRFTPFGGETVQTESPLAPAALIREMELLHLTYLNIGYHPRVLQAWRETEHEDETIFHLVTRRMGYRFVAQTLEHPRAMRRGATLPFVLRLRNTGFAAPCLPRVVEAAIVPAGATRPRQRQLLAGEDPRRWGAGGGPVEIRGTLPVPADCPRGPVSLALRFADPAAALREDGRFAIRLANEDVRFSTDGGWNILADDIECGG